MKNGGRSEVGGHRSLDHFGIQGLSGSTVKTIGDGVLSIVPGDPCGNTWNNGDGESLNQQMCYLLLTTSYQ